MGYYILPPFLCLYSQILIWGAVAISERTQLVKNAKSSLITFTSSATSCLVHLGYYGLILVRSYENIYSNNHGITTLTNYKTSSLTFPLYLYHEKSNFFFGVDICNIYWCHTKSKPWEAKCFIVVHGRLATRVGKFWSTSNTLS